MTKEDDNWRSAVGGEAQLLCTSKLKIIFCTFLTPRFYQNVCHIVMLWSSGETLRLKPGKSYEEGRISFFGSNPNAQCGIKLNSVEEKDFGEWT